MNTIQLSTFTWDLQVDSTGSIALATDSNAIAQDVASAVQTHLGEMYYDTAQGVPYLSSVLGQAYSPALLQALMVKAALTVPGVVSAKATVTGFQHRKVSGRVEVIDSNGQALGVTF